jgi:hypothetical protein
MAMLQDRQNAELRKHISLYNVVFTFTSTRIQSVGFKLGPGMHTYKSARKILPLDWWYGTRRRVIATLSSSLCA